MDVIEDAAHRVAGLGPRTIVMLVMGVFFLIVSWISFALRVYVRALLIRSFGKDDWMMLITVCLFTICCSLLIAIEHIEQTSRPQRVLEEGIHAQLDLLNDLMKVCFACCSFSSQLTKSVVYHFPDGLVHPHHCHIEN